MSLEKSFLAFAEALGATADSEGIHFERDGRRFLAVWNHGGKGTPARVRLTTNAGPCARSSARRGAAETGDGPFRSAAAQARIESPAPLTIRLETDLDRQGKKLRLNRETQTGDADFDQRIYLESEAPDAVVLAVLADPIMRDSVMDCLTLGCDSLTLDNDGNLSLDLPVPTLGWIAPERLSTLLAAFGVAAEAIPLLHNERRYRSLIGRIPRLSVVAALVSFPLFFVVDWLWKPVTSDLYWSAATGGLALWILSLPLLFLILRGRAVSQRDLSISALALAIGLPLGGADLLLTLNGLFDPSAPVAYEARVIALRQTTGKHASQYLTISTPNPRETIQMRVSLDFYLGLSEGTSLIVTTRRGFFGWERITSMVPAANRN